MPLMQLKIDENSIANINKQFLEIEKNLQSTADSNYINLKINANDLNSGLSSANTNIKNVTTSTQSFGSEIGNVVKRSLEWSAALIGIHSALQEVGNGISFITDLDTKISDIAMITGKSKDSLQEYAKAWNQTAINMKTTTNTVVDSNEEFMRAGKSIDESNKLTETNIKLSRISGEQSGQMAEDLVKLSNAYSLNSDQVEKYANKVSYLDSATAASSKGINSATIYAAQAAQQTGTSLSFLMSMVTTVEENSKKGAEAIGRSFKSMFLNMEKIQQTDTKAPMSDLEKSLNKQGIALRENEHQWRKSEDVIKDIMKAWSGWDSVTKSIVTQYIAGKNQAEEFMTIMNKSARVQENYNNALGATNNLDEKYKEHLNSTQGSMNELKATTEKMWMSFYKSSAINGAIKGLTSVVTVLGRTTSSLGSMKTVILTLTTAIILLNSKAIGGLITDLTAMCAGETIATSATVTLSIAVEALGTAIKTVLMNPVTWIVAGCVGVVAGIIAVSNHQQKLKEQTDSLATSFNNLTTAMKENNTESMNTETESLKKEQNSLQSLLQQKQDLENQIKNYQKSPIDTLSTGYSDLQTALDNVNKKLQEQEKVLNNAGIEYDSNTGKIKKLVEAKLQLEANSDIANINAEADSLVKEDNYIINLINEYKNLSSEGNKSAKVKMRLSQISQELSANMKGLVLVTDSEGNVTIKNTNLIDKEIKMRQSDITSVNANKDAKLNAERDVYSAQVMETNITYNEIVKRIAMYKEEADALQALADAQAIKASSADNEQDYYLQSHKYQAMYENAQSSRDKLSVFESAKTKIDAIFNSGTSNNNATDTPTPDKSGYTPESTPKDSTKSDKSSSSTESYSTTTEIDTYKTAMSTLTDEITRQEKSFDTLTASAKRYSEAKDYANAIKTENTLLTEQEKHITYLEQQSLKSAQHIQSQLASDLSKYGIKTTGLTDSEIDAEYNKIYGKTVNFGTGDAAKKQKDAYDKQAALVKKWIEDYKTAGTTIDTVKTKISSMNDTIAETKKNLDSYNLSSITKGYSDSITKLDDKISDLDLDAKKLMDTDYAGKAENTKEKISATNEELQKSVDVLNKLKATTALTAEGQANLNTQIEDATDKVRTYQSSIADLQSTLKSDIMSQIDKVLESAIYGGQTQQEYEDEIDGKIAKLNKELDAIEKINTAEEEKEASLKRQNELLKLQKELTETEADKNVRVYTGTGSDHGWEYQADAKKVAEYQEQIKDKQDEINEAKKEAETKAEKESLQSQITYYEKQKEIREKAFSRIKSELSTNFDINNPDSINGIISTGLEAVNISYGNSSSALIKKITINIGNVKDQIADLLTTYQNAMNSISLNSLNSKISSSISSATSSYGSGSHKGAVIGTTLGGATGGAIGSIIGGVGSAIGHLLGFANGGETPDDIPDNGGVAILHKKERVLTSEQTESFNKFVNYLPDYDKIIANSLYHPNNILQPDYSRTINNNNANSNSKVEYNIHVDKVETQNVDGFVSQLKNYAKFA